MEGNVGYVPQDIFLINGSLVDNICFGKQLHADKNALSTALSASCAKLITQTDINLDTEILKMTVLLSRGWAKTEDCYRQRTF